MDAGSEQGCRITTAHKVIVACLTLKAGGEIDVEAAEEVHRWLDDAYERAVEQIVSQFGMQEGITLIRMIHDSFRWLKIT